MACIAESRKRFCFSPLSATVAELKHFLAENSLPTTGKKAELQERVANYVETEDLELAINAKAFVDLTIADASSFRDLLVTGWTSSDLLTVGEQLVAEYLQKMGGYTKNQTGARLA